VVWKRASPLPTESFLQKGCGGGADVGDSRSTESRLLYCKPGGQGTLGGIYMSMSDWACDAGKSFKKSKALLVSDDQTQSSELVPLDLASRLLLRPLLDSREQGVLGF
jgi:hypothetical protein